MQDKIQRKGEDVQAKRLGKDSFSHQLGNFKSPKSPFPQLWNGNNFKIPISLNGCETEEVYS